MTDGENVATRDDPPLSAEQERLNLTRDFGNDWIIWPGRAPLDPTITWMATRKRRPSTDDYIDGVRENLACKSAALLRVELLDQAHLEAALFDLEHA